MSKTQERNTQTVAAGLEVKLSASEQHSLRLKGRQFYSAERQVMHAQNELAAAQREYDQQFGRFQGCVELILEMKGLPAVGANVRYDPDQDYVRIMLPPSGLTDCMASEANANTFESMKSCT